MNTLDHIINLNEYPIHKTETEEYKKLIDHNRQLLDKDGCCLLPNFVLQKSLNRMKEEIERNLSKTHWTKDKHNPALVPDIDIQNPAYPINVNEYPPFIMI